MSYNVFISHSSRDKSDVRRLAEDLELAGITVWLDEWEILVGDRITQKIQQGLETCDFIAVWLTCHAIESGWVEREWQAKYGEEVNSGRTIVLPLLDEDCKVPILLRDKRYADFRQDYSSGLKELIQVFQPKYKNKIKLWPSLNRYFKNPASLNQREINDIFRYSLDNFPFPFVDEGKSQVDALFIRGPSRYELVRLDKRFDEIENEKGSKVGFRDNELGNRILLGESVYNLSLVSELISEIMYIAGTKKMSVIREKGRLNLPYMEVDEDILARHNIIIIPCGDVNPLFTSTLIEFEMRYSVLCPVHHFPYHSSESIRSEITHRDYEKEREEEWAGYILLIPNPWNPEKAALVCGGNRGVGTQAALLRILLSLRGEMRLTNSNNFPAKVVTAKRYDKTTLMVSEVEDLE